MIPYWTLTWLVSIRGSTPVVSRYQNGIIYLKTDADVIYLNEDSSNMFSYLSNVTKIDTTKWDTSNVTNMENMFYNCNSLTDVDVSNWNVSNVEYMTSMFEECNRLTGLDVSNWDTSSVVEMWWFDFFGFG